MWLPRKGGGFDLQCDTSPDIYQDRGRKGSTLMAARAAGWHVYEGLASDGVTQMSSHLCPPCVGTNRSMPKKVAPLGEDQLLPLFSEAA